MFGRGRARHFAALARLRLTPPEIFAERKFQAILARILAATLAGFLAGFLAAVMSHSKSASHAFASPFPSIAPFAQVLRACRRMREPAARKLRRPRRPPFDFTAIYRPPRSRACLRARGPCGKNRTARRCRLGRFCLPRACCRSSVVEHSLGKGEVDSSILSGSTIKIQWHRIVLRRAASWPFHEQTPSAAQVSGAARCDQRAGDGAATAASPRQIVAQ